MHQIITIRSLKEIDIDKVVKLDEISFGGLWNKAQFKRELNLPNSHFSVLSMDNDNCSEDKIVGMGCWRVINKDVEIPMFAIAPNYQSQGVGSYFFAYLLKEMVEHDLRLARLDVNVNNPRAIALYKKFGFRVFSTTSNFYKKTQEDAHQMMLPSLRDNYFQEKLTSNYKKAYQRLQSQGLLK